MTTREKNQLRNLTYLPLAAAIFAGAVYTGTAVSSAAADPGVEPSATGQYSWMVMNYTGQTLTSGEFHKQRGENSSSVVFGGAASQPELTPGTYAYAWQQRKPIDLAPKYTWGRVCFNHQWWNLRRDNPRFEWDNVYLYAFDDGHGGKKLVANPDGARMNIPMVATDAC